MIDVTRVEWVTAYPSGPHELISCFSWVRDFQYFIFDVLLCGLLSVLVLIRTNIILSRIDLWF